MHETDRRQNEQPATPAEIASAKLSSVNPGVEAGDGTQIAVPLAMAEEINRRHGVVLDEWDEPTTVYDGEGRPLFIGSYKNGEY